MRPRIDPRTWLRSAAPLAATALALAMPAAAGAADGPEAGTVRFMKGAESVFDPFTRDPSPASAQWMRDHYARMRTYASYFDTRTSWFPNAWTYKDAYAIYPGSTLASGADRFILRDGAGGRLYIPFACSGGTCPQYAADIGNPEFRAAWIGEARSQMSHGYRGLYVDDVNTYLQVSDGTGANVAPVDPRTGATMTTDAWTRYMADFMVEIRAAFPDREVIHNPVWFAGDSDPQVQRAMQAADVINVERGINDGGLTAGTGQFALRTLLAYVDHRHAEGHGVVWDSEAPTDAARRYGLAGYFVTSNGKDYLGTYKGGTPADWWTGYDVRLGAPLAGRYDWNGVIRRDFAGGFVLLNLPGSPARTLTLPSGAIDLAGAAQSSVTMAPASGSVYRHAVAPVPTPAPKRPKKPPHGGRTPLRITSLSAKVARTDRRGMRRVRLSGRVKGAAGGTVSVSVRRAGRVKATAVLRRRVLATGAFSHVQRLRTGTYELQVSYLQALGVRATRRFVVR